MSKKVKVKQGDFIIPVSGTSVDNCPYGSIKNKKCKVTQGNINNNENITILIPGTQIHWNLNSNDKWIIPNREELLKSLSEQKAEYLEKIKEIDAEIEFHTKYEDEDQFLAEKIEELVSANSTKESRIEAIKLIRKHIS
jgi:glycerophosphoryl diester phosphodiesterase